MRVMMRAYMSTWMLRSAQRFARMAHEIEVAHAGDASGPHAAEYTDYVIAAVLGATTFMEAMVNEVFTDAFDRPAITGDGYLTVLRPDTLRRMRRLVGDGRRPRQLPHQVSDAPVVRRVRAAPSGRASVRRG